MKVSDVAAAAIAPKILNKFRWSWLAYGAAAGVYPDHRQQINRVMNGFNC